MLGDHTSIYFKTELNFFPIEDLRFGKSFVRNLYMKLAEPGGYQYEDLSIQSSPYTLSTKRVTSSGSGESVCKVGDATIQIEEINPSITQEHFIDTVKTIVKAVSEIHEHCPPVFGQRCIIRCLAKPNNSEDSVHLLAGKVSNVLNAIDPFERPPSFFGVRFRFPPVELTQGGEKNGTDESQTKSDFVSVRFETWAKDVRQVWLEVNAMNFFLEPVKLPEITKISENWNEAYEFLTGKCFAFLNQFDDHPNPEPDEEEEKEE